MMESVQDVILGTPPTPAFTRRIEVQLVRPVAQVRYDKGKAVREAEPDMTQLLSA